MRYPLAIASVCLWFLGVLPGATTAIAVDPPLRPSAPVQPSPRQLSRQQLEIGGISTLSTEAQVRAKLGKPRRLEEKDWPCCGKIRIFDYPSLRVQLIETVPGGAFSVFSVSTQSARWATRDGVRIGDSRQRVIDRYGPPSSVQPQGAIVRLTYFLEAEAAQLSFEVRSDRVVRLSFDEQLN
jgi:hypothetical protein